MGRREEREERKGRREDQGVGQRETPFVGRPPWSADRQRGWPSNDAVITAHTAWHTSAVLTWPALVTM